MSLAPPLVPTTRNRRLLPQERHSRRSLLPPGAQLQSQRRDPPRTSQEIRQNHRADPRPLQSAEGLGQLTEEREPEPHRGECGRLWVRDLEGGYGDSGWAGSGGCGGDCAGC